MVRWAESIPDVGRYIVYHLRIWGSFVGPRALKFPSNVTDTSNMTNT